MSAAISDVLEGRAASVVLHGECEALLPLVPDGAVDSMITDPPYSAHVHGKQRRMLRGAGGRTADGQRSGRGQVGPAALGFDALTPETREAVAAHAVRTVRRWVLAFSDLESVHLWQRDLSAAGARHTRIGVWNKLANQPQLTGDRPAVGCEGIEIAHVGKGRMRWSGGGLPARWDYAIATDRNQTGARMHTTQKPLDLMRRLVELFTEPGEVVIDPFCGSGTTGVACLQLGRRFIGFERDANYAAVAAERLAGCVLDPVLLDRRKVRQPGLALFGATP